MCRLLLVITCYIVAIPLTFSQSELKASADSLLKASVDENHFVGVAAGFSIKDSIVWESAKGYSDLDNKTEMNDSVLVRTASIAKPMTAVAVMQLFEQGKLELDVPIQNYIPDYPKPEKGDITIRHLLNHTSGISAYQSSSETESQINYQTLADAANVFKNRKLLHKPGSAYYYTTYGYVVLGLIIEQVSGLTFNQYMQTNIWDKAGMINTGIEDVTVNYKNKSKFYYKNKRGKLKNAEPNNLSNRTPGGGFHTTVADMLKFGNAIINNTLIKNTTLQLMLEIPKYTNEGNPYGMGWFMYGGNANHKGVFGHSGEQTGAATQLMIIPTHHIVIVVLGNTSGSWKKAVSIAIELINTTVAFEKGLE